MRKNNILPLFPSFVAPSSYTYSTFLYSYSNYAVQTVTEVLPKKPKHPFTTMSHNRHNLSTRVRDSMYIRNKNQ